MDQTFAEEPICHEDIVQQGFCLSHEIKAMVQIYGSREGTIQKYFANPKKYFKSQYFSQITVEKFEKSKNYCKS